MGGKKTRRELTRGMNTPVVINRLMRRARINRETGCIEMQGAMSQSGGHKYIKINAKLSVAHRFMYREVFGDFDESLKVCHQCDNPSCINPAHLFLGTQADNVRDMDAKGRRKSAKGECHGMSKITEGDVREIRRLHSSGEKSYAKLMEMFSLGRTTVRHIVKRKLWRHVK